MMTWDEYVAREQQEKEIVLLKMVYVDMTGDLISGLLLSQIVYWNLPSKTGKSKLRVAKNGKMWLAKKREDWWNECRISVRQVDRAMDILVNLGIIETRLYKFDGNPTTHIRLNGEKFMALWTEKSVLPKDENGYSPLCNMELDESVISLTETTTETTTDELEQSASQSAPEHAPKYEKAEEKTPLPTLASAEFFKQFKRKRWATPAQGELFYRTEEEVGAEIMMHAVAWGAQNNVNKVTSICTAAKKMAQGGGAKQANGQVQPARRLADGTIIVRG